MTGIEPGEDVSIKPVRGKLTKKHVSEPITENDAERLPSPNYKWHVANGTDLSVDLILAMEAGGHSKVRGWRELFTKATERDSTSWNDFNWNPFYSWLILCVLVFTEIIYQKSSTRRAFKLNIYHFHLEFFFLHKSVKKKRRPASSFGSMAITLAAISASFWWWSAKAMSRCLEIIFLESLLRKQVPGHFRCCRWHRERLT